MFNPFPAIIFMTTEICLLILGVKVTQNVAQYPLHHVTFAAARFEVPMSNCLGEDAFTRKYIL